MTGLTSASGDLRPIFRAGRKALGSQSRPQEALVLLASKAVFVTQ